MHTNSEWSLREARIEQGRRPRLGGLSDRLNGGLPLEQRRSTLNCFPEQRSALAAALTRPSSGHPVSSAKDLGTGDPARGDGHPAVPASHSPRAVTAASHSQLGACDAFWKPPSGLAHVDDALAPQNGASAGRPSLQNQLLPHPSGVNIHVKRS